MIIQNVKPRYTDVILVILQDWGNMFWVFRFYF